MSKKRSLANNAILNTIKTVLGVLFPLITFPYVSRVLGVKNLGIYNFSFSFLSYFLLLAALGISTYGIREGTQYRDNRAQIEEFVGELFSINIFSTLFAYLLLILLLYAIPFMEPYRKVVLILSVEIIFTTVGVSWVCNIYEDFLAITVRTISFQIVSLILIFVLVRTTDDLYKYVGILLLSNSGANIVNYFYVRNRYCKFHFSLKINWRRLLRPILIIFSTTVTITVYVSSDTTMLGFMTNDYEVGLYGTAVKIYTIMKNVLAAILTVLIPQFSLMFSNGNKEQSDLLFSKVFNILTAMMLPMCIGLFSLSEDVVQVVSGREYIGAAGSLKLLSIAVIFSLYSYMYTQCVLIPIKEEKIVLRATLISAIVNIVLNFILIPIWGINAAAFTTIMAELITFVISFIYSKRTVKLISYKKNIISTLIGCIFIFLVCFTCKTIDSLTIRVTISVFGSVLAYGIVLLISNNPILAELKEIALKRR